MMHGNCKRLSHISCSSLLRFPDPLIPVQNLMLNSKYCLFQSQKSFGICYMLHVFHMMGENVTSLQTLLLSDLPCLDNLIYFYSICSLCNSLRPLHWGSYFCIQHQKSWLYQGKTSLCPERKSYINCYFSKFLPY